MPISSPKLKAMNTTTTAMSFAKPFTTTSSQIPTTTQHHHRHLRPLTLARIKCKSSSSSSDSNITTSNSSGNASPPVPPPTPPPEQVLFRRGRRRSRKEKEDAAVATGQPKKVEKKDWDSMTMSEKAVELYVGEKGILFWLNKLAYASIYVMIGGWILFRFVGPALNLYQLDSAPLPPTALLKGS